MGAVSLEIRSEESLADRPLESVIARGLEPGGRVTLRARTRDEAGVEWASRGVFRADSSGTVDLSRQAPAEGTFAASDPSALLWAMRPDGDPSRPVPLFEKNTAAPLEVEVSVESGGGTLARAGVRRHFLPPGGSVRREAVDREGFAGALFLPAGKGPFPVVICLSGSGGGFSEPRAALLASRGYAAFALAYFNAGSLPRVLREVPLEFLEKGLGWLEGRSEVDSRRLAVYGFSKGGELALLLGSLYPRIRAVAAVSGAAHVWQGLDFRRPGSSWSRVGKPLPFLRMKVPLLTMFNLMRGRPVAFRESYERGLRCARDPLPALIPVEKIAGPVFLVAGTDDRVWPSAEYSDAIAERLERRGEGRVCEYLREEGAGHLVGLPYFPAAEVCRNLVFASSDLETSSRALIRAWDGMLAFLAKNL